MSTSEVVTALHVVDTGRYPLTDPGSAAWREIVDHTRDGLREVGCSVLKDFIRPELQERLRAECAAVAPYAYDTVERVNAYNIALDTPLPDDHPGRTIMLRGNAFVARDQIPATTIIQQLYTSPVFQRFVADCFSQPVLHELADPLSGLTLNVIAPGRSHPWHFDTNEFTVSMITQEPEAGGRFEYCPNIRRAGHENLDGVAAVLAGNRDLVRTLDLRPGDLQLFLGRYSLHRVNPVDGTRARHSTIFAYSERADVIGSPERTKQLFGRVTPEHLASAVRGDELLD